jgi:phosphopantetheinyl transferase
MNLSRSFCRTGSLIDLWITPIEAYSETFPLNYSEILSYQEKERWHRFKEATDRKRYLVSHIFLREVLSHITKGVIDPHCWRFTENKYGKPAIDTTTTRLPLLYFNLSCTQHVAVVAVSPSCPVGVDIEPFYRPVNTSLIDTVLSPGEKTWLQNRPSDVRLEDITRLWTVKEAYAKLLGLGLSLDFSSFEVTLDPVRIVRTERGKPQPKNLFLETWEIHIQDSSFHLSLAARCLSGGKLKVTSYVPELPFFESTYNNSADFEQAHGPDTYH